MIKKIISIFIATLIIFTSMAAVSAQSVSFTGTVDGTAKAVTVLVTNKNTDLYNLSPTDIVWMNQARVSQNGTFTLNMPLFTEDYDIHTNASSYEINEIPKKTVYLSSNGNDANDGFSSGKPKKTLSAIYRMLDEVGEIVILNDTTFSLPSSEYEGNLSVKGYSGTEKISISGMSLKGNLKLDNLVFNGTNGGSDGVSCYVFANGFSFEMGENLTSTGRITVYGGKSNASCESTDLKLFGGQYKGIYGGGYNGSVTGDTNVIVGGNVNPNDDVDDSNSSTLSPTYVYGGSYGAAVGGKTNVTISGNATVNCVIGAGNGSAGTASDTNINITGGKAMNVYGGGLSGGPTLSNCNTHITMTGGKVEGIFGGCEEKTMTGTANITLKGGEVTRRVYGGCYTESGTGKYVNGATVINIYPDAALCTGNGLSWINTLGSGIYAGSKNSTNSAEKNYIIFSQDCYSAKQSKISKQPNYTVKVGNGGDVTIDGITAKLTCYPDMGRGSVVNNVRLDNPTVTISEGTTTVTFDGITSASAQKQQGGVTGDVSVSLSGSYALLAAVYDASDNRLIGAKLADYASGNTDFDLDVDCTFEQGKKYIVQFFLWNDLENTKPLTTQYIIDLK